MSKINTFQKITNVLTASTVTATNVNATTLTVGGVKYS